MMIPIVDAVHQSLTFYFVYIQLFCVQRPTFKQRHDKYSDMGLLIRCVRKDESISTNVIHYVEDGSFNEFTVGPRVYLMPVFLLFFFYVLSPS